MMQTLCLYILLKNANITKNKIKHETKREARKSLLQQKGHFPPLDGAEFYLFSGNKFIL